MLHEFAGNLVGMEEIKDLEIEIAAWKDRAANFKDIAKEEQIKAEQLLQSERDSHRERSYRIDKSMRKVER
jgi:hypothetical protein